MRRDPECLVNLAGEPEYAERKEAMREELFSRLKEQGDVRAGAPGKVYDEYRPERIPEYEELVKRQAEAEARRKK